MERVRRRDTGETDLRGGKPRLAGQPRVAGHWSTSSIRAGTVPILCRVYAASGLLI